jgi:hypothetical protein
MRRTDSALAPISDLEFAEGLRNLEGAIARGERPRPTGTDLVVLTRCDVPSAPSDHSLLKG